MTFSPADARGRRSAQFLWRSGQSESPEGRPGEEIIPHCSLNTLSLRLPLPVVSPQRRCVAAKCVHGGAAVRSRPLAVRLSVSWVGSLQDVPPNYFIVGCFKRDTSRFYRSFQLVLLLNFGFAFLPSDEKVGTPCRCKRSGAFFFILLWWFFFPLWNLKSLFLTVLLVCSFLTSGQRLGESTAVHRATTRDCRCKKCSDSPDRSDDSRVTGDSVGNPAILLITGSLR